LKIKDNRDIRSGFKIKLLKKIPPWKYFLINARQKKKEKMINPSKSNATPRAFPELKWVRGKFEKLP
jgi:hypothetical protein